jgi:hypothetical protein
METRQPKKVKRDVEGDVTPKKKVIKKKLGVTPKKVVKKKPIPEPDVVSSDDTSGSEEEAVVPEPRRKNRPVAADPEPPVAVPEPVESTEDGTRMFIEPYNTLSFIVRGDTRPHSDELRRLSGKFNPHLRGGPGWVFSVKRQDVVSEYVDLKNSGGDVSALLSEPVTPQHTRMPKQYRQPPYRGPNYVHPPYPTLMEKGMQRAAMESNIYTAMLIWHQMGGDMAGFHHHINVLSNKVFEDVRATL